jgi:hypothetical protein
MKQSAIRASDLEELVPQSAIRRQVPTALYRVFDATGQLLYVGITESPKRRWAHHVRLTPWWGETDHWIVEWHCTRWHAETAEIIAIKLSSPKYNVQHSKRQLRAHYRVRAVMKEIRDSSDPELLLRHYLRDRATSHHMRQVLVIAALTEPSSGILAM